MRQPSPSSGSLDANTPKAGGSSTFSTPALSPSPFSSPSPSPAFVNTVNKDEHDHSHRLNASLRAGDGPDEHGHRQSEGQASGASPTRQDGHEDVEDPSTYPSNRLWLVMAGIMGQVFLSALDQSIVSTATPTIVADLQSSPTQGSNLYSWIGTSYLLTSSATIPLYASVSDVIGRRPCLWIAGALFLGGSALCGAAQSLIWLILGRALAGLGGGGLLSLSSVLMSDIIPLQNRARWWSLLEATWAASSVAGPLLGGVISERTTWRWIFFINLPTGVICSAILFKYLHLNPLPPKTMREFVREYDFVGLALLVAGVICFLLGFNSVQGSTWREVSTIVLINVGGVIFILFGLWELRTSRKPIVPARCFKTRTAGAILLFGFFHFFVYMSGIFYLPVYFQGVQGKSPSLASAQMLPYNVGADLTSVISGLVIGITGYRLLMWGGSAIMVVGIGLMSMLDVHSSIAQQEGFLAVAALGLGALFVAPVIGLQTSMPRGQVATATAAFSLVRTLGGTIGLSVSGALLQSEVESRTASILGYTASSSSSSEGTGGTDIRNLHLIEPYDTRIAVLDAYSNGLKIVWLSGTAVAGGAFVVGLFVRGYGERKKRKRGRTEKPTSSASSASSPSSHQHSQSRPVGSQTLGGRGDQEEEGADLEMEMAALEKHPAKRGEVELLSPISKGGDVEKMQSPSPK